MVLNLDKQFNPYPTETAISFESFTFSGGEPHIKILNEVAKQESVTVTHRIQNFEDFGLLLLAIDALKGMGVKSITLLIPYFPAARQDRRMINGEPLSVKVYAEILNALNLESIAVFDAHSEVTLALLENSIAISNHAYIKQVLSSLPKDTLLISPDGGALKKIYKLAAFLQDYEVIECSKSRDVKTGKLSGFQVYADDLQGKDCLIVDDICDGGGTFLGLADQLKAKGAGKLHLAISHGIFNKGTETLLSKFQTIHCTNAFSTLESTERFIQHSLTQLLK
ncbi:ribose-phosphate diphosphokinase [Saprospiraceae bacterium]|nr:ribose-phosphate diphosphokinase [Saprospiraceae bacterium]